MTSENITSRKGLGWFPDYPDYRDYTMEHEKIKLMSKNTGTSEPLKSGLPSSVDLKKWCSPVEDQGQIGSCTANATAGIVEYYERRAFGNHIDASRLFLYKASRNLMHQKGDTGAFLRVAMEALVLFGVPPEEYWPYTDKKPDFDKEPTPFCYAFGQNYQAINYVRLDPQGTSKDDLLNRIKTNLAAGLPSMFGFTVYNSIWQAHEGKIPFPSKGEKVDGGHAIVAVGYDDSMKIKNPIDGQETTGAFMIRNSWGKSWGQDGYGWLPYKYALQELAVDWWTLLKNEWIDTGSFKV